MPSVATALSIWPAILSEQQNPVIATLIAVLHNICIEIPSNHDLDARAAGADDSVTAGSWSGTTAGQGARSVSLIRASQQEIVQHGQSCWGWASKDFDMSSGSTEMQRFCLPAHSLKLLTCIQQQYDRLPQDSEASWGLLSCALAIVSLSRGWQWIIEEVSSLKSWLFITDGIDYSSSQAHYFVITSKLAGKRFST